MHERLVPYAPLPLSLHQGNDSVLELFAVLSDEEVKKKMTKKLKKAKKKAAK